MYYFICRKEELFLQYLSVHKIDEFHTKKCEIVKKIKAKSQKIIADFSFEQIKWAKKLLRSHFIRSSATIWSNILFYLIMWYSRFLKTNTKNYSFTHTFVSWHIYTFVFDFILFFISPFIIIIFVSTFSILFLYLFSWFFNCRAYLRDVVETAHIFYKLMEKFCSGGIVVQDKRKARKKGKGTKSTASKKQQKTKTTEEENVSFILYNIVIDKQSFT